MNQESGRLLQEQSIYNTAATNFMFQIYNEYIAK